MSDKIIDKKILRKWIDDKVKDLAKELGTDFSPHDLIKLEGSLRILDEICINFNLPKRGRPRKITDHDLITCKK
jgi:hypothetical protein